MDIMNRVEEAYKHRRILNGSVNPVKKVGLLVAGHDGQLFVDQLPEPDGLVKTESDDVVSTATRITSINDSCWD